MPQQLSHYQPVTPLKRSLARAMRKSPTPAEALLWEALRGKKLKGLRFRRQQVAYGYILDFYCESKDLAIEVDGGIHEEPQQQKADRERENALKEHGLRILRFDNAEVVGSLDTVLQRIEKAVGPC